MTMDIAAQRSAVALQALSWLGTPYHHHGRLKGVGVDCAMFLAEVYESAGLVEHVDPGQYAPQWHLHRDAELFIGQLQRHARQLDGAEQPQLGDVALWRFGRCFSHGSIVIGPDQVVHSYVNRGVVRTRFSEHPLLGRAVQFWTLWTS